MAVNKFEVIVIGAGPAGWSAATFLARANIATLVIGDPAQSGLADASEVSNFVGFPKGISGTDLLEQMREQATSQGAKFLKGEVTHVEKIANSKAQSAVKFLIRTARRAEFSSGALLLAHGANFIKVNLPGEKELVGKGVHYCALCDGPLYKGKKVIVLGNGNYAAEEALQLAGMGVKVEIITHAVQPNIAPVYQKLLASKKIRVTVGKAEKFAPGIKLMARVNDAMINHSINAVFIALGVASSLTFAKKLGLEMNGNFLKANEHGKTNISGVWVAGLARGGINQIAQSVGEGASAAVDIIKTLKGLPMYLDHT